MATVRTEADDLQRQMAEIRSQLHQEMRGVVSDAATATDWRSYIRAHPWLGIGLAFASGFLLVPRRARPLAPSALPSPVDVQIPQAAARKEPAPRKKPSRWSLVGGILHAIGPIAVRVAQSYAMNSIENLMANQPAGPRPEVADKPNTTARPAERRQAMRG